MSTYTALIREEIYYSQVNRGLFPEEQIGSYKGTRGTGDLLYGRAKLDGKMWIDYKKSYDMVPLSCIRDCLKMNMISDKVINFIAEAIKNWKEENV